MYAGSGYSDWEIGDIDVFIHEGIYHLFHLIIPNHDYIAHAISRDGISWSRVKNALFVGDPGQWDDDMLWTMHVSKVQDGFRMFYTGLQRKDRGRLQKIGLAESKDLFEWYKVQNNTLPFSSQEPIYESLNNNPREWLSFRDPYRFVHEQQEYILMCARSSYGPISRRGCVGLAKWVKGRYELQKPLLFPMVYDDIECPCVCKLNGLYYLIGSIREDIKIRYWFAKEFLGEYRSFHSDVLLPQGNYAARIVADGSHNLVYNFYFLDRNVNSLRVLPPPKQLDVDDKGRLILRTFYRWNQMVTNTLNQSEFSEVKNILSNKTASIAVKENLWMLESRSGYEIFRFNKPSSSFIWEGVLTLEGLGKCGLISDMDGQGNGYFIPFDFVNGYVTIRKWGFNESNTKENFVFQNLQANLFKPSPDRSLSFRLVRYGNYIELSINGIVKLTLMDYTYSGEGVGLYSASSLISLKDSMIKILPDPKSEYASQEQVSAE